MRSLCPWAIVFVTATGCAAPPAPAEPPPPPADPAGGAELAGRVILEGEIPAAEPLRFDADPQCQALVNGAPPDAEDVVVGDGNALQNVFVYLKAGLPPGRYPAPREPVLLDQQKCRYVPRVLGVQTGQPLKIRNGDPLLHTVHANAATGDRFNIGTPVQGMEVTRTFQAAEVMVPVTCDMHPWMHAYIGVLEHPFFAVTDAAGEFAIRGLPAGTYVLEAWHERLGTQTREVTVAHGEHTTLTLTFGAVPSPPR